MALQLGIPVTLEACNSSSGDGTGDGSGDGT